MRIFPWLTKWNLDALWSFYQTACSWARTIRPGAKKKQSFPGWGLRGFQRWWPLFQKFSALTRAISVLIQRCTLSENFWAALNQLWSALKNQFFRATKSALNSVFSAPISCETALVFSETAPGSFPFLPPPPALLTKLLFPPLADMLSWAVWFKFLLNKVIANTCLFILTGFGKQSASWKVLEICELCALSTDSRKTYSVNKYMYTGSSSYSFDWGGEIIRWGGGRNGKDPSSEQRWFFVDSKMTIVSSILFFFRNITKYLNFEEPISDSKPKRGKEGIN